MLKLKKTDTGFAIVEIGPGAYSNTTIEKVKHELTHDEVQCVLDGPDEDRDPTRDAKPADAGQPVQTQMGGAFTPPPPPPPAKIEDGESTGSAPIKDKG